MKCFMHHQRRDQRYCKKTSFPAYKSFPFCGCPIEALGYIRIGEIGCLTVPMQSYTDVTCLSLLIFYHFGVFPIVLFGILFVLEVSFLVFMVPILWPLMFWLFSAHFEPKILFNKALFFKKKKKKSQAQVFQTLFCALYYDCVQIKMGSLT